MVARNPPTRYAVVAVVFEYSTFCGVSWELGSARNVVFKKTHRMWNIWTQLQSGSFLLHAMLIVTIKMMSDILCRNTTFCFVDDTRDISCHMPYCVWKKDCNPSQTGLIWARRPAAAYNCVDALSLVVGVMNICHTFNNNTMPPQLSSFKSSHKCLACGLISVSMLAVA